MVLSWSNFSSKKVLERTEESEIKLIRKHKHIKKRYEVILLPLIFLTCRLNQFYLHLSVSFLFAFHLLGGGGMSLLPVRYLYFAVIDKNKCILNVNLCKNDVINTQKWRS